MADTKLKINDGASPSGRRPLVRGPVRTSRPALTEQGRLAEKGLSSLCGLDVAGEPTLGDQAIRACVAIRDASVGTIEWAKAVLEACAIADEADGEVSEGEAQ